MLKTRNKQKNCDGQFSMIERLHLPLKFDIQHYNFILLIYMYLMMIAEHVSSDKINMAKEENVMF